MIRRSGMDAIYARIVKRPKWKNERDKERGKRGRENNGERERDRDRKRDKRNIEERVRYTKSSSLKVREKEKMIEPWTTD